MATYRLQLHEGFGFLEARSLLPYLRDLGITSLYSSPLFQARRGSLHGYSVTNPLELNPELGSKAAFDHLAHKLKTHGMEHNFQEKFETKNTAYVDTSLQAALIQNLYGPSSSSKFWG